MSPCRAHQPLSLRRNFGQSPAVVAIRIRSGSSQQTIRNVVASVLRGDQGALGPETRKDALDSALTVGDQDLVLWTESGFELVSPQSHSLSTFGCVLSEEVPWHSVLAAVSSHDIGFLRSLAGDVPADPDTLVSELHGIMNAELRGRETLSELKKSLGVPCPATESAQWTKDRRPSESRDHGQDQLRSSTAHRSCCLPHSRSFRRGSLSFQCVSASAGSDLQNRTRLPRLVAESELLVTGLGQNDHQQPAPDVFLSNRDPSTDFRTNRPSAGPIISVRLQPAPTRCAPARHMSYFGCDPVPGNRLG